MDFIYALFDTDKDGFFKGLTELFEKVWNVLLPFLLSAKFDEMFGTQK